MNFDKEKQDKFIRYLKELIEIETSNMLDTTQGDELTYKDKALLIKRIKETFCDIREGRY